MSVPRVHDCSDIQDALRNATIVLGEAASESIQIHLQTIYHIKLDPPCSSAEDIEKALFDLLGTSSDLIVVRMRSFLR